jgi:hypothetical protein
MSRTSKGYLGARCEEIFIYLLTFFSLPARSALLCWQSVLSGIKMGKQEYPAIRHYISTIIGHAVCTYIHTFTAPGVIYKWRPSPVHSTKSKSKPCFFFLPLLANRVQKKGSLMPEDCRGQGLFGLSYTLGGKCPTLTSYVASLKMPCGMQWGKSLTVTS